MHTTPCILLLSHEIKLFSTPVMNAPKRFRCLHTAYVHAVTAWSGSWWLDRSDGHMKPCLSRIGTPTVTVADEFLARVFSTQRDCVRLSSNKILGCRFGDRAPIKAENTPSGGRAL